MKRIFSITVWIIFINSCILLLLSLATTQKTFYSFIFKSFLDIDPSFNVAESNWHPIKPSIVITNIKSEDDHKSIAVDEIFLQFSLFNISRGKIISNLYISNITIQSQAYANETEELFPLVQTLRSIDKLSIKNLKINLPDDTNLLNLSLDSSLDNEEPKLSLYLKDKQQNILEVGVLSSDNSNGALVKGYIQTNKFELNDSLISLICKTCEFDAELETQMNFTLFKQEVLNFQGNMVLKTNENLFGFNSISSSFQLRNKDEELIQVSSVLNDDDQIAVPNYFINFTNYTPKVIFPELNLSNSKLIETILEEVDIELSIDGLLQNLIINFDKSKEILKADIQALDISHAYLDLRGLVGRLSIYDGKGELSLNSPLIRTSSSYFLDKDLEFYDFNSLLNLSLSNNKFEINPSSFSSIIDNEEIEGLISFLTIPTKGIGDINLRIKSKKMNDKSALSLFPNTSYLSLTKEGIDSLIDSAQFENLNLIYRGPVDGVYTNNSSSFVMQASGRDISLDVNGYKILGVNADLSLNNFILNGKISKGDFFGSEIEADFKTFKLGSSLYFDLDGKFEGPFSTLLKLTDYELQDSASGGFHETDFYFSSPLKKEFSLLDKNSQLEVATKIEKAELNASNYGFNFTNIFSTLNYDNEKGFKEGYVSLKLNSIPIIFDLDLENTVKGYSFFSSRNSFQIKNLFPIGLRGSISGTSSVAIQVAIPSLISGQDIKKSYLEISSNLLGTELNLPDPFYKSKEDSTYLNILLYPTYTNEYSRLQFKLGEIIRGKLNLFNGNAEGFLIAGKEKQSISIESGKISLIGNIDKLDLSIFSLLRNSTDNKVSDIDIKKLEINEVFLSNFYFPKTIIKSRNSNQYLELVVSNDTLSGSLYLPKKTNQVPIIDLQYINLNFSQSTSDSSFLDFYNNFSMPIKFKTDSLVINSSELGNWAFELSNSYPSIVLDEINGTYGKWGLTKNKNNISRLKIKKNEFGWNTNLESKIYSGSPEKAFKQIGIDPNFEMDTIFLETNLSWQSLPWQFDFIKAAGDMYIEVEGLLIKDREDLQAQNNILRLVNIFNVTDSFEKVTNLDFRKLYKSGFSADNVKGNILLTKNSIQLINPLVFKSGSSEFKWEGKVGRDEKGYLDSLDLEVIMTLPLREYLPAYAFLLGGPITAGVVYIAGKAFERNLDQISSGSWSITGTLQEPVTEFKGWFEESND
ncbi:hypothetical protein M9C81_05600 [SAR86 cluster bacterium]|nr:hypothetical protein M9C81_05600 [SAR86 cluster bacterium]